MWNLKTLSKGLLTLAVLLLLGLAFKAVITHTDFNQAWIDSRVRNHGITGIGYFLLLCAITTACGLPRQIAAFLGGYAFGVGLGTVLSTLGTTIGCAFSFFFARLLARRLVNRKFGHKIAGINRFLQHKTFTKTIIIRLLPVGSNLITNLVAGVCQTKGRYFISGSMVGYIPQMLIFALAGSGVEVLSVWKIMLSVLLFVISTILSARLYRQYKLDKQTRTSLEIE